MYEALSNDLENLPRSLEVGTPRSRKEGNRTMSLGSHSSVTRMTSLLAGSGDIAVTSVQGKDCS